MRPHRRQPTRLPCPWDSPGKNTGVDCHFLLQCMKVKIKVKSLSHVRLCATPWTAAYQAPPSMGFSRQEYWSGVPLPSLNSCSNLCPLSWWCYLTISSFCFQVFPASGSFLMSWCFISGGQSTRASASVLPVNFQGWFRLDWFNLLVVQGILKTLQSVSYLGFFVVVVVVHLIYFISQISENIQYLSFFFLFRIRFIHAVTKGKVSFFIITEW